jgi:hypothetical protein
MHVTGFSEDLDKLAMVRLLEDIIGKAVPEHIVIGLVQAAETLSLNPTFHPLYEIFLKVKKFICTWRESL